MGTWQRRYRCIALYDSFCGFFFSMKPSPLKSPSASTNTITSLQLARLDPLSID